MYLVVRSSYGGLGRVGGSNPLGLILKGRSMRYDESIWIVWDTRKGWIAESGDNSLPLIFDNENDALDVADESPFWEVHQASMRRIV